MGIFGQLPQGSSKFDAFMQERPASADEAFSAAEELAGSAAFSQTLTQNISRAMIGDESGQLGIQKLSVQELKSKYPDVEAAFTEPTYPVLAENTAKSLRRQRELEDIIAAGPQGWKDKVSRFGASIWGTVKDPGELALMALAGVAGRALKLSEGITTAVQATRAARLAPLAGRLGAAAVEGTAMAIPSQLSYGMNQNAMGQEYTAGDFAEALAANAVLIGATELGIHYGKGLMAGARNRFMRQAAEVVTEQANSGVKPNISPMIREHVAEMYARLPEYEYRPLAPETKLYAATESAVSDFAKANDHIIIGDHIGDGVYLTDNPHAANGMAASKISEIDGTVFKFDNPNLKLADYTLPFPESMRVQVERIAKQAGVKVLDLESETASGILEQIRRADPENALEHMNAIQKVAKEAGFDGAVHDGARVFGGDAPGRQNIINIFDREKLTAKEAYTADRSKVPDISKEDMQSELMRAQKPEQALDYQAFDRQRLEEAKVDVSEPKLQDKVAALEESLADINDSFKALQEQGAIAQSEVTALEEVLQNAKKEFSDFEKAARQYAKCRGG